MCVQSLAESGISKIPGRYVKPPSQRPDGAMVVKMKNIPVVDMEKVESGAAVKEMAEACREWGFFQIINHGISGEMMECVKESWKEFFNQPLDLKKQYANTPATYEGYGSRLGIEKEAILDWSDYFFLNFLPLSLRNPTKWPAFPPSFKYVFIFFFFSLFFSCFSVAPHVAYLKFHLSLSTNCPVMNFFSFL